MNLSRLKQAEEEFLQLYPEGFNDPEMIKLKKKHNMDKMIRFVQESFSPQNFKNPQVVIENLVKTVSRSSMVSMFEKPKFRDYTISLDPADTYILACGLDKRLHGNEQEGFEMMLEILVKGKLAKWSLISICAVCYNPQFDVFVKPTTAKGVIETFELDTLQYKPAPTWAFYQEYRKILNDMKSKVDPSLSPNNAAFTGFLMMTM